MKLGTKPTLPPAGILELLYTPETLQLHLTENWTREKIETFALSLLGEEYQADMRDVREALKKTQLLLLENDELRSEDKRSAEARERRLQIEMDEANKQLKRADSAINTIERAFELRSKELADAREELERLKLKVPLEANDVADILSGIIPNRSCNRAGCFGKRGYTGITVMVDPKTGHRKTTINLCCGVVGETEYTRLRRIMENGQREQRISSDTLEILVARSKRYTLIGGAQYLWRRVDAWLDRVMPKKGGMVEERTTGEAAIKR